MASGKFSKLGGRVVVIAFDELNEEQPFLAHLISVPGCDLYVGGGEAVTGGMFVCRSNSNNLSRYSCMDAW